MKKCNLVCAVAIMSFVSMLSVACTPSGLAVLAASPTLTSAPTATMAPTPTPTMSAQDIKEIKFNQNIHDFMNETGEYTDEAINGRLLSYHDKVLDMGWVSGSGNGGDVISLQGWFIDYIIVGDYLIMAVGFNDNDGENHVKPLAIPIKYFENGNQSARFSFEELRDWNMLTHHHLTWEPNADKIIERLDVVKDNPVLVGFLNTMSEENIENAVKVFGEGCEEYFIELRDTKELVNRLLSEISISHNESILIRKPAIFEFDGLNIPDIQSVDDLKNIDISVVPRVYGVSSNLW